MAQQTTVISMRLPAESGSRLKRMAGRHGWTASDTSARLVEEGLRRSEFAFTDFRDSAVGRQAYIQGTSLAVWEVVLLLRSYGQAAAKVAAHLQWPESKVAAAQNYAQAFPDEIGAALQENAEIGLVELKRMLPNAATIHIGKKTAERARTQAASR